MLRSAGFPSEPGEAEVAAKAEAERQVLFSDIRGFTTLTEQLAPQAIVSMLNE